jgi:hypothetical protein
LEETSSSFPVEGRKRTFKPERGAECLGKQFSADQPNRKWIADIKYVRTAKR